MRWRTRWSREAVHAWRDSLLERSDERTMAACAKGEMHDRRTRTRACLRRGQLELRSTQSE